MYPYALQAPPDFEYSSPVQCCLMPPPLTEAFCQLIFIGAQATRTAAFRKKHFSLECRRAVIFRPWTPCYFMKPKMLSLRDDYLASA